jgi:DNA-binding response OmpR family regulator
MAGETIIVADDKPVSLQLTQKFLANQGYKVVTASSGGEAVELLRSITPDLLFADLQSADWNSLELARCLKQNESTRNVLALAAALPGEEGMAIEAGCDGYLMRPVEVSALGLYIRAALDHRVLAVARTSGLGGDAPGGAVLTEEFSKEAARRDVARKEAAVELDALRHRFLVEGHEKSSLLLRELSGRFDIQDASKAVHQWIGTGGLLGFAAISRLSREAEQILSESPLDSAQLRDTLGHLMVAFASPEEAREELLPPSIVEALKGKRIVAVEFTVQQQERLFAALERVQAQAVFLGAAQPPDCEEALTGDIVLVHVNSESARSAWLDPIRGLAGGLPVVLMGKRDDLLALPQVAQALAREFLMDSWQPEEALVRLSLAAAHRPPQAKSKNNAGLGVRTQVVIADDDPMVLSLVRIAVENFGMDCHAANNGADALETIRRIRPHAAVLDVNMPAMDGYEVLAAVRREDLPVRVLLLTARQQESDVIRGFTLGADDYMVKPFSPMELVARLKRLLAR